MRRVGIPQPAILGDVREAYEGVAAAACIEEVQELVIVEGTGGCAAARELFLGEDADGPAFVVARDAVHLVDGYVALLAQVRLRLDEWRGGDGQGWFVDVFVDRRGVAGRDLNRRGALGTRIAGDAEG